MKLMYFKTSSQLLFSIRVVSFLLAIVLVSCGSNVVTTPSSPVQTLLNSTAKKPASTFPSLKPNPTNINVTVGNLLIQSTNGFQCPNDEYAGLEPIDQLVLTSDRTTYSKTEIEEMRTYLTNYGYTSPTETPSTLQWILGGATTPISWMTSGVDCNVTFMLTNTGNTIIQIPKVGVQLEARPQLNSRQYHLIDACNFDPTICPPVGGGGPGACSTNYFASIQLGFGEKNDVYSAVPSVANDPKYGIVNCGILTIAPAKQDELNFSFFLKPNIPQNLIFSFLPIFTVITAQGEQTISFPQMISTLAFASAKQFSCYGLHGTTFVLIPSPTLLLPSYRPGNWCI